LAIAAGRGLPALPSTATRLQHSAQRWSDDLPRRSGAEAGVTTLGSMTKMNNSEGVVAVWTKWMQLLQGEDIFGT
jgi:hypothetical protein